MATSTVSGRFKIILCSGVGCQTSMTASEISLAYSTSVALKLSGEYWSMISVPLSRWRRSLIRRAPFTAMALISSLVFPNTTRRWAGEVELYMWMITRLAPIKDSTVRSIKSSRACTKTWSHTSSGARFSSMRRRLKVNSVLDAEGKPTSISLNPILTSVWNSSNFWETFMGTARAWLPSRKSTLHQRGAAVRTRLGHWRSGRTTGGYARYFLDGSFCMIYGFLIIAVRRSGINKKPTAGPAVGLIKFVNNQYPAAAPVSSAFTSSRLRLRFTGTR